MCSLCGVLGNRGHWTESATNPRVFDSRAQHHTSPRERQQRVRLVNQILEHYDLTLADWAGNSYVLRNRTGRSAILANLDEVWAAADKLSRAPCDPLDSALLASLANLARR